MPRFSTKTKAPAKIATTIHLQKLVHNSGRQYKAERAIKEIVKAGQNLMGTEVVKIDQELNSKVWYRSRCSPPTRVRVIFERKADAENSEKMITVASYVPVESFKGLQTEKVE